MRVPWVSLPALFLSGIFAWCQPHPLAESNPQRFEIYGGPAFTGDNPSGATFGAGLGIAGNFNRWAGALGEFTFVRDTCCVVNHITLTDYLVGPRIGMLAASSRVSPFADFLFGGQTLNNSSNHHSFFYGSGSGPAISADAGFDLRLSHRLAVRGQVGYIHSRFATSGGSPPVLNNRFRGATYAVWRF